MTKRAQKLRFIRWRPIWGNLSEAFVGGALTGGNNLRSQPSSALALTQWAPLVVAAAALSLYLFLWLCMCASGRRTPAGSARFLCDTRAQSCNFTTNVKKNRRKGEKLAKERSGISIAARLSHLLLDFLASLEAAFACESADSAKANVCSANKM